MFKKIIFLLILSGMHTSNIISSFKPPLPYSPINSNAVQLNQLDTSLYARRQTSLDILNIELEGYVLTKDQSARLQKLNDQQNEIIDEVKIVFLRILKKKLAQKRDPLKIREIIADYRVMLQERTEKILHQELLQFVSELEKQNKYFCSEKFLPKTIPQRRPREEDSIV